MNFLSKLYIFTNLLEQADNHKTIEDPLFGGFGQYISISNPVAGNTDGRLFISANATLEARSILKMIWDEAMTNFRDYALAVDRNNSNK